MSEPAPGSDVWKSFQFWQPARRYVEIVTGRPEIMLVTDGCTSKTVEVQDQGPDINMEILK